MAIFPIIGGSTSGVTTGVVPPSVTNDSSEWFVLGDTWVDVAADKAYVIVDNVVWAAVWKEITQSAVIWLQNNFTAAVAPTVTDDSWSGYAIGSVWVDTVTDTSYTLVDATVWAAVWAETSGWAAWIQNNFAWAVAPTVTNDSASGYTVWSVWIDLVADKAYTLVDSTVGAAVWIETSDSWVQNNFAWLVAPVVTDDSGNGYTVWSTWVDTVTDRVYVLVDSTVWAAVWTEITPQTITLNNIAGTTAPVATDDSGDGYTVWSLWMDTTNDKAYILVDSTVGAAVWVEVTLAPLKINQAATTAPTVTNDTSEWYEVGSNWYDTTNDKAYVLLDDSAWAAVWIETTEVWVKDNLSWIVAPVVTDDNTWGYTVWSTWVDTVTDKAYILVDSSTWAAVWKETTNNSTYVSRASFDSWTLVQGNIYPDYQDGTMGVAEKHRSVELPAGVTTLIITEIKTILHNDVGWRWNIVFNIQKNGASIHTITLPDLTSTLTSWSLALPAVDGDKFSVEVTTADAANTVAAEIFISYTLS